MKFVQKNQLAGALIIFRLISVLVVQTYHVPDEYWQSLEVAHNLSFGYGYLTWEWQSRIRSYIYPFFISILYKILALCRLDCVTMLINIPRVLQAILSGYADYRFYTWTRSKCSLFLITTNWYWFYCSSRTLANTLETSLTTIALSMFPWKPQYSDDNKYLWIVGFVCAIRPTMAIPWLPLCIYHVLTSRKSLFQLIKEYLFIGICTVSYSVIIDSYCYGQFTVTYWEFFKINILNSIASHYGQEPSFWYLTSGLPVVVGLPIVIFPLAAFHACKQWKMFQKQVLCLISTAWTIGIYSILPHKEFRFILPLLPLIILVCTTGPYPESFKISCRTKKILIALLVVANVLPGFYVSVFHQRGPLDLMNWLRNEVDVEAEVNVMFLMPCHSTPFYSHLHKNISMNFLTCEPNLKNQKDYLDEADQYFVEPSKWFERNYKDFFIYPSFLVLYDNHESKISNFLRLYKPAVKIFNTHFPLSNCGKYINVYKLRTLAEKIVYDSRPQI